MKLIKQNLKLFYLKNNFFLSFLDLKLEEIFEIMNENNDDKIIKFKKIKLNKIINENINKFFYSINLKVIN